MVRPSDRKVIRAARLWDGRSDKPCRPGFVALDRERVFACAEGPAPAALADWPTLDLGDVTLVPGCVDVHVHLCLDAGPTPERVFASASLPAPVVTLLAARHAALTLEGGVTSARDCGGVAGVGPALRDSIDLGLQAGPRLRVAGQWITMTGGGGYQIGREADGIDDCRRAAREQLKSGADFIKVIVTGGPLDPCLPQLDLEEIAAAVAEARKAGKHAAARAGGSTGIKQAILAGVRSIEHGYRLTGELAELMVERGVYLVPAIPAYESVSRDRTAAGPGYGPSDRVGPESEAAQRCLEIALRGGVKIAMGSDAGSPANRHGQNLNEIEALVGAGMRAVDAWRAATSGGAGLLGLSDLVGTIEPGKQADLVAIRGDPLADVRGLPGRVFLVMQRGRIVSREVQGVEG